MHPLNGVKDGQHGVDKDEEQLEFYTLLVGMQSDTACS